MRITKQLLLNSQLANTNNIFECLIEAMRGNANPLRRCARHLGAFATSESRRATSIQRFLPVTSLQKQWTSSQCCNEKNANTPAPTSITSSTFWNSKSTWKRASVNTTRCLIGCTAGDFTAMWILQAYYPDLSMAIVMPVSSKYHYPVTIKSLANRNSGLWHLNVYPPRDCDAAHRSRRAYMAHRRKDGNWDELNLHVDHGSGRKFTGLLSYWWTSRA